MEVKIQCGCGTKYKFEVEAVDGRMPVAVACPNCGANGTADANEQIGRRLAAEPMAAAPPPPGSGANAAVRVARAEAGAPDPGASRGAESRQLLERAAYFVKERVTVLKLTDTYDILDPATGQAIGIAREQPPMWAKWLRLVIRKHSLPTQIDIYEQETQPPIVSIRRGLTLFRSKIRVVAGDGRLLGHFQSKLISLGGGFNVFDQANQQVAEVKGDWKGWNFRFLNRNGRELGVVTKKWAGLGKELFTAADNYIISITDVTDTNPDTRALLLAAGLAIDIVYKEDE